MSLKDRVMNEGMKLASHPAVAPLLQDERFMKLLMTAMSVPGKLEELTEEQKQTFAKKMGLATHQEVADLQRTVRSLEDELARLRHKLSDRGHD